MKMRKLLSGIVAGAIAASAMIVSSSAATYEVSKSNVEAFKKAIFKGSVTLTELDFRTGSQLKLELGALNVKTGSNLKSNETVNVISFTVNGVKTEYGIGKTQLINFALSNKAGSNAWENDNAGVTASATLAAGKYRTFDFVIEAVIADKDAGYSAVAELCNKMDQDGYFKDQAVSVKVTPVGQVTIGDSQPLQGNVTVDSEIKFDSLADGGTVGGSASITLSKRPTLTEKNVIKNAVSAKIDVVLSDTNADITLLTAKIGDTTIATKAVVKNDKSATLDIDPGYLFNADYDDVFDAIKLSIGSGKIASAKLTVDDGDAAPTEATEEEGTPAEAEEEGEPDLNAGEEEEVGGEEEENGEEAEEFETDSSETGSETDNSEVGSETGAGTGAGATDSETSNPKTGVAVAVIPAIVAAAAVVIARKRK